MSGVSSRRENTTRFVLAKSKSTALPDSLVRVALEAYEVTVSAAQIRAIRRYIEILLIWNQKVSLTSVVNPTEILSRHFGESMFAATKLSMEKGRLADVGSGAGFPGLALKIIRPELQITLIEANAKKAGFLAEVVRHLGLEGVEIQRTRYEDLSPGVIQTDFIAARALGSLEHLLGWAKGFLAPGGRVVLWLGAQDAERLSRFAEWNWTVPVPIPKSYRRVLLLGQKSAC